MQRDAKKMKQAQSPVHGVTWQPSHSLAPMSQAAETQIPSKPPGKRRGGKKGSRAVTKGRIAPKQREAIRRFLVEGEAPPLACEKAGIALATFYATIRKPEAQIFMAELTDQLTQEFEALKPVARLKALYAAMTAIDEGEKKAGMLRAVEFCAGIDKKVGPSVQTNVQINVGGDYAYPEKGQRVEFVDVKQAATD